ncbi:P-loop containing nucleoside triphosphate hydrolase protein [Hypoxylon sp. NC1633]|nr:P-loop containing nucleoside triphosphate hydrolase protein [Hypoxylon sp. NC1633]
MSKDPAPVSASGPEVPPPDGPLRILSLGLPRTGSSSMAEALRILGFRRVHHGTEMILEGWDVTWVSRAAKAHFPSLSLSEPGEHRCRPFTREEWDEIFGGFDAVTDYACMLALPLIAAYPEAKVILVHRDIGDWERSVNEVIIDRFWPRRTPSEVLVRCLVWLAGAKEPLANGIRQTFLGRFDAAGPDELRANLRKVYVQHMREVQEAVSPEQLLHYRLGDGWEPLCEFLGKEVPEGVPFPRRNDAKAFGAMYDQIQREKIKGLVWVLVWYGVLLAILAGVTFQHRRLAALWHIC